MHNKTNTAGIFFSREKAEHCLRVTKKFFSLAVMVSAFLAVLFLNANSAI